MNGIHYSGNNGCRFSNALELGQAMDSDENFCLLPDEGGLLSSTDQDGIKRALILNAVGDGRFCLCYDISFERDFSKGSMWVSVGKGDMSKFIELPLLELMPEGSAISAQTATAVLREFLSAPNQRPLSISWVDESELDWPED